MINNEESTSFDERRETQPAALEEIRVEAAVDGEQAATEEQTAVVSPAGEHGGRASWEILPAGGVGEFPEDGAEEFARVGGRATAACCLFARGVEGFDDLPLAIRDVRTEGFLQEGQSNSEGTDRF